MFPEPDFEDETFAIPLGNIEDRIQFDQLLKARGEQGDGPEDRREPEEKLQRDCDQLTQIAQKNHHGGGKPGEPEYKEDRCREVITSLQPVK